MLLCVIRLTGGGSQRGIEVGIHVGGNENRQHVWMHLPEDEYRAGAGL